MSTVLASAADERYGFHLLNLIGSVKANSDIFDRFVVYDLGLNPTQRRLIHGIRGIEVETVPPFVPHWAQCFTWKPWIWTHTRAENLLWLDAGMTVLRSLAEPTDQIRKQGYFAVSNGQPNADSLPTDYYGLYGIARDAALTPGVHAGIIGFRTSGRFYDEVIVPTFDDVVEGRSLGFSASEVDKFNFGLNELDEVIVRDAPRFRHDQTVLNARILTAYPDLHVNELDRYAGWQSPRDDPQQLVWNHRRRGDYRYLWRVPYTWRAAPSAWLFTLRFRDRRRPYLARLRRPTGRTT